MKPRFRMIRDEAGHMFATPGPWPTGVRLPCGSCTGAVRAMVEALAALALDEDLAALARAERAHRKGDSP